MSWGRSATSDVLNYRQGYPGKRDDPSAKSNLLFYSNSIPSRPSGDLIDDIHKKWFGDYRRLEAHHGFIQWLFPIREDGLNWDAQQLQLHEAAAIAADPTMLGRVVKSFELMLDFYGFRLKDPKTGEVERVEQYRQRFDNLNRSSHNYLRITRILKALGEFQLEHLKLPWLKAMIDECFTTRELPNIRDSLLRFWIPVLRNDDEREEAERYAAAAQKR